MTTRNDILIIGGGIVGLAIAVELKLRGASVSVLSRDIKQAATNAAAGMLAPNAENIAPGAMLELCRRSRSLYSDWCAKLEAMTGKTTGYWECGILALLFKNDASPLPNWLDKTTLHHHQPGLNPDLSGAWWYPDDAQVDNRVLYQTLQAAAQKLNINIEETTAQIVPENNNISLQTPLGKRQAGHYILATGAWSNALLPIPIYPKKGQMLALYSPAKTLQTILYGENTYIVPRQDGRIIIGATSEDVQFTPNNTPEGVQTLLRGAFRLYPELQDYPIQEKWWGFRPATPDELPILGASAYSNLTLATGHYRNGILLAPVTASLIADWVLEQKSNSMLEAFHYSRFEQKARYSLESPI